MKKALKWSTVKRKVNDLLPLTINPRKISNDRLEELKKSLEKFNLAEIPIVNHDNTLIGGNQRCKVLQMMGRGDEVIEVRYPNRQLSEHELKEYALTSNSHAGEWDFKVLEEEFGDFNLDDFHIEVPDLGEDDEDEHAGPSRNTPPPPAEHDKKWFVYIDAVNEKEAQKMYEEMSGRGFETKIVN